MIGTTNGDVLAMAAIDGANGSAAHASGPTGRPAR
jgi:hypothetical protein